MKRTVIFLTLVALLLLVGSTLAMESANYRLDWLTPLTGSGGEVTSSTNFGVNLTVGQTAASASSSTNYGACLGFWCKVAEVEHEIFLPLVLRGFP